MHMLDFLFASENVPFMIALGVMLVLGLLEGITAILGLGVSSFIDSLLPEPDIDLDVDVDVAADAGDGGFDLGDLESHGPVMRLLGWLRIGRVPVLILLVLYLFAFAFLGLLLQSITLGVIGFMLPAWIAVWPPFIAALFIVHLVGGLLARVIPKGETEAVSERKFIGRIACITLGTASAGSPAQARLRDSFGQAHYVMVEPDADGVRFQQGDNVLLVGREGSTFRAIANPNEALVDAPQPPQPDS